MKTTVSFLALALLTGSKLHAQTTADSAYVRDHYEKNEVKVPMRDGKKLFTVIYSPKDKSRKYPLLLNRTPYTVSPYGQNEYKKSLGNFPAMMRDGYIFVYQDVRGKWMSEGDFEDVRPTNPSKDKKAIDESTDTYDALEWLQKNLKNYNGKAGLYGISYPGFYSTVGLVKTHPSLKAVSPQAPVTDWFIGDDFHHNGVLFLQDAFTFMSTFGVPRPKPITPDQFNSKIQINEVDKYNFFLEAGTARELKEKYFGDSVQFWNNLFKHPNYDDFWKTRVVTNYLQDVKPAVMVVGGFYDAEDAYGTFKTYQSIEEKSKTNNSILVAGPWYHGGWVRAAGDYLGDIQFEKKTSITYQEKFEQPFFSHYLKQEGSFSPAEANIFISGSNKWKQFEQWPPKNVETKKLYFQPQGKLGFEKVQRTDSWDEYVTDPNKPVPHQGGLIQNRTREYMVDDQRFAASRPDVMVYQTAPLTEDITIVGPIKNFLKVASTGTDADYIVKLIDVYPNEAPSFDGKPMAGYQMMVRGEIMAGKYRNGFDKPQPLTPGMVEKVDFVMPDVAHTFKKGHRIMVQVQNSWFPLAERNPQVFMEPYTATKADFRKATQRIFHDVNNATYIEFDILKD
nr:CocE/NonD family hydrolase [uncultured Sphingobacterium sp.]